MDPATAAAMSAASSVASSGGNFLSNIFTNDANKKMQQNSQNFAYDMWNKQNAYNTPQAQMQRYKDAGLNPNLIYGSGSASSGNAGPVSVVSPAHFNAPPVNVPDIGQIFRNVIDLQTAQQNLEMAKWNTAQARQDSIKKLADNELQYGSKYLRNIDGVTDDGRIRASYVENPLNNSRGEQLAQYQVEQAGANIDFTKMGTEGQRMRNVGQAYGNELTMKQAASFYYKMVIDSALQAVGQASKFFY